MRVLVCFRVQLLLPLLLDDTKLDQTALLAMFPDQRPGKESTESLVNTGCVLSGFEYVGISKSEG